MTPDHEVTRPITGFMLLVANPTDSRVTRLAANSGPVPAPCKCAWSTPPCLRESSQRAHDGEFRGLSLRISRRNTVCPVATLANRLASGLQAQLGPPEKRPGANPRWLGDWHGQQASLSAFEGSDDIVRYNFFWEQ